MAQAGIHSLVGIAAKKWTPNREWMMLGIVLGNLMPDLDNLLVAIATVAKLPTVGLHRTFTHSFISVVVVIGLFYIVAKISGIYRWNNLGIGLAIGMVLHILLDLLVWFNGVALLWPIPLWVNFWENATPPEWWMKLMMPIEFLFFAIYFIVLGVLAQKQNTDERKINSIRIWTVVQIALFIVFTILVYTMGNGFMTPYGAIYLLSLGLAVAVTIRMRDTVERLYE